MIKKKVNKGPVNILSLFLFLLEASKNNTKINEQLEGRGLYER